MNYLHIEIRVKKHPLLLLDIASNCFELRLSFLRVVVWYSQALHVQWVTGKFTRGMGFYWNKLVATRFYKDKMKAK